jgi:ribose transport system substrate-binding protein
MRAVTQQAVNAHAAPWRRRSAAAATFGALTAVTVVLAACGGSNSSDDRSASGGGGGGGGGGAKQVRIAAFMLATANNFEQAELKGIREVAAKEGNVTVQPFDGGFSGSKQASQIQDAVASGKFNAFIIAPNDGVAVVPPVRQAIQQGVKVVARYAPIGPNTNTGEPQVPGLVGTVWSPTGEKGTVLGKAAVDACKQEHADADPCEVAFISGSLTTSFSQEKLKTFKAAIATSTSPAVKLVQVGDGQFAQGTGAKVTQDILAAHPDLDVIVDDADQMAIGSERVLDSQGKLGKISLIGNGATVQGVQGVKAKKWFATMVTLPESEGAASAKMVIGAVRGKPPAKQVVNLFETSPIGEMYTQQTKGDFQAQWSG